MTERLPCVAAGLISALGRRRTSRVRTQAFFATMAILMGIAEASAHSSSNGVAPTAPST